MNNDKRTESHIQLGRRVKEIKAKVIEFLSSDSDSVWDVRDLLDTIEGQLGSYTDAAGSIAIFNLAQDGDIFLSDDTAYVALNRGPLLISELRREADKIQTQYEYHRDRSYEIARELGAIRAKILTFLQEHPEVS